MAESKENQGGVRKKRFYSKMIPMNCTRDGRGVWYDENNILNMASNRISGEYIVKEGTRIISESAFRTCEKLTKIVLPKSLEYIEDNAFCDCISLKTVIFSHGLKHIGNCAFAGCKNLKNALLPDDLEYLGNGAFFNCEKLTDYKLPTSLEFIGHGAFDNTPFEQDFYALDENGYCVHCGYLMKVRDGMIGEVVTEDFFPKDVKIISFDMFMKCKKVYFPPQIECCKGYFPRSIEEVRFRSKLKHSFIVDKLGIPETLKKAYIPKGTMNFYKKMFHDRVHPEYIEEEWENNADAIEQVFNITNRRYIGCKSKLLDWIFGLIDKHTRDVHSFCDIFAGTGVVSNVALQKYDHVIVNDFLYSNNVFYTAFFEDKDWDENKVRGYIESFNMIDAESLPQNFFSENYGGKYFDMRTAKIVGFIREYIERIRPTLTIKEYCILITSLVYSIDRIANTLGHFEAYIKKEIHKPSFRMQLIDAKRYCGSEIHREDANELARKIHVDVLYMDPPYNSRQYSRFYHVYEVLIKWNKPELKGDARKPAEENMSDYCRTSALKAFTDLVARVDSKYIVVSYNNTYYSKSSSSENKIKLFELQNVLEQCGETLIFDQSYQPFNAGKTEFDDHKEYLFITKVDEEKRNHSFSSILCGR